ncbi:MAG TPA: metallophosphoesterase [Clostridiales bacterium]|nr:metallophosphoesterase [Clostridiales bacterium]
MWILIIILLIIIICIISNYEHKCITTSKYEIQYNKLLNNSESLSLVVLSDLHNNNFGDNYNILIKEIDKLSPDYILIAGDMITKRKDSMSGPAIKILKQLSQKYKIIYGFGNHEQYIKLNDSNNFEKFQNELTKHGVIFLDNKTKTIKIDNKHINITGINLDLDYYYNNNLGLTSDKIDFIIGKPQDNAYNILIAHNPNYFNQYIEWGADLILSGHLHGGIIRLPLLGGIIAPKLKFFPKYAEGQFCKDNKSMIVSRGLGSHTIKLRLFNKPEIISIIIK